jgi:hypothetical protein
MKLGGLSFRLEIKKVVRELREIYKEFNLDETEEYLRAPYSGFRFNCRVVLQEDCEPFMYNRAAALLQNVSNAELLTILLPSIDFSDDDNFNALTPQQKTDLLSKLQP